jgi:hypothetical protein
MCAMLIGCTRNTYHLYSPNNEQCITIINDNKIRYIIDGYKNEVPVKGYVKIDLSKIDREVGDHIVGCWNENNFKWNIFMDNVTILENKLDKKNNFHENFPHDKFNIPNLKVDRTKFKCFGVSFDYGKLIRLQGEIQE